MSQVSKLDPGQSVILNGITVTRYSSYLLSIPQPSGQSLQIAQATVSDTESCIEYWVKLFKFGIKKHDQLRYYGGIR